MLAKFCSHCRRIGIRVGSLHISLCLTSNKANNLSTLLNFSGFFLCFSSDEPITTPEPITTTRPPTSQPPEVITHDIFESTDTTTPVTATETLDNFTMTYEYDTSVTKLPTTTKMDVANDTSSETTMSHDMGEVSTMPSVHNMTTSYEMTTPMSVQNVTEDKLTTEKDYLEYETTTTMMSNATEEHTETMPSHTVTTDTSVYETSNAIHDSTTTAAPTPEISKDTTESFKDIATTASPTETWAISMRVTEGITWTDKYNDMSSTEYKTLEKRVMNWVCKHFT